MNPYAAFLGNQDPLRVIAATPQQLRQMAGNLTPQAIGRAPAPGKWSVREVFCHLADCEVVFAFRLRQAVAEEHHVIQPFDQDLWARSYASYDASTALETFTTTRHWNSVFLSALPPETFKKTLRHPERGDMTFRVLVETIAGHDLNHVKQIERILA